MLVVVPVAKNADSVGYRIFFDDAANVFSSFDANDIPDLQITRDRQSRLDG
jgi:hypothetical protein